MLCESSLALAIADSVVSGKNNGIKGIICSGSIDWGRVKGIMSYHGLMPFGRAGLKEYYYLLPEDLVETLEASYYYSLAHISYLQQRFLELHDMFETEGITFVPIKGVALLDDLYEDMPVRPSSDIDVLVKEEDMDKAVEILEKSGYKKNLGGLKESYWRNKQYHFIFNAEEINGFSPAVELHWDLDYRRYRRRLLPDIFSRLRDGLVYDRHVKLLSPEDTFFALALHQRRFGIALSLRDVCDMARLLNKYKDSFDWDYVLAEGKRSKVCSTVYFALCQINLFFCANIPEYVWNDLSIPGWKIKIIRRFIQKNTFSENQNEFSKNNYLKAHFLLYDSLWEPVDYILNIPQEQFAKFYGLDPYSRFAGLACRLKPLYVFYRILQDKTK